VSARYSKLCHSRDEVARFRKERTIYAEVADENNNGREVKYEIN